MSLVNMKEMLAEARKAGRAVGAFNVTNYETAAAVLKAAELGGAVSGEHGRGILKAKYLPIQYGEAEIALMRGIKKLFDPKGILNPHVMFEPADLSGHSPLRGLKLPWDAK